MKERSMNKRWFFLLSAVMIISMVLSACGAAATSTAPVTQPPAATESPAATTEAPAATEASGATEAATQAATGAPAATEAPTATATLPPNVAGGTRVAVVRGAMIDTMRKLADKYMQANPGKIITVEEEPEGGAFDALIAAGNQPDIITVSFGTQTGHYAAGGVPIPLEDLDGAKDLFAKIDPATVQNLYGHNYYMPVGADVTMLIYNKDLFKEAGLDPDKPPTTVAQSLDYAAKIDKLPARADGTKVRGTVFWNDALAWGGWY